MSAKFIFILCVQALFVQAVLSKCPLGYTKSDFPFAKCPYGFGSYRDYDDAYGFGLAPCGLAGPTIDIIPTSGGGLPVTSVSSIAPIGLTVTSENVYEGILAAAGELPFVGTVTVEGLLPTAGAGAVSHHCGDGINAIISENSGFGYDDAYGLGYNGAFGLGLGAPGLSNRAGWTGKSCGCGYGLL